MKFGLWFPVDGGQTVKKKEQKKTTRFRDKPLGLYEIHFWFSATGTRNVVAF